MKTYLSCINIWHKIILTFFLLTSIVCVRAKSIEFSTSETVSVHISSSNYQAEPLENFTLDIMIGPVTDLMTFTTEILYDPAVVTVLGLDEGEFLSESGNANTTFLKSIDNSTGKCLIAISRMTNPASGLSSSETNTLMSINLKANNPGNTILKLNNIGLIGSDGVSNYQSSSNDCSIKVMGTDNQSIVSFYPSEIEVFTEQIFESTIQVNDVNNLFAGSFDIYYDPELLEIISISEGDLLNEGGNVNTIFLTDIDNENGKGVVGITRLNTSSGVSSAYPQDLFHIKCRAKKQGNSKVQLSNTGLIAPDGKTAYAVNAESLSINILPGENIPSYEFDFISGQTSFTNSVLAKNSKSYFYYYVNQNEQTPSDETQFNFNLSSGNNTVLSGVKYLGNGIMQYWVEIDKNFNASGLQISLPNSIFNENSKIIFKNKPLAFNADIKDYPYEQSIDIFAGGSVGVKLIAGGVGAGPSAAAASLSVNGTGGMGLNFHHDSEGNEYITRRFEAGVGLSLEAPKFNVGVGDIQAGVKAGGMVKGLVGQTMYFPNNLDSDITKKAKAAYIMETFTMGGVELSPLASVFLRALKNSLVNLNPDLSEVYSGLYYSEQTGTAVEGEVSVGFSVSTGDDSNDKMDLFEISGHTTLSKQFFKNIQNDSRSLKFAYAAGFEIAALNFEFAGVDFGNQFQANFGTDFSLGANYKPETGISSFELSFGATATRDYTIATFSDSYTYNFLIPRSIILKNQEADNIVGTVAPSFIPGLPKKRFRVGMNYYTQSLDELYTDNPNTLNSYSDHIIMETLKTSTKGIEVDAKVGLDAALGIGAGLSVGIHFSYLDEMSYPKKHSVVAHNKILPIAEYNDIPHGDRLFSIKDEVQDLFQGTVLLIKEPLNNLINVIERTIESGKEFVIEIAEGAAKITGKLVGDGWRWITRTSNPTTKSVQKSAFLEPKIINAYSSRRIIHLQNKSANLANEEEESVLYIVSENINVSLVNSNNEVIYEFEPVMLSIAIDNDKMSELGFGEEEKELAKMYQYDSENLLWIELAGDSNDHLDTVSTFITNSASYAIGIELNSNNDNTAPDIQDYYPKDGEKIEQVTNFWAKLYESPTGVGIDFSQTVIKIDDAEVDAIWNPLENIISFESADSLSIGQHTFEVIVKDYNGNTNSVSSTVTVGYPTDINSLENIVRFNCYPVPMKDILNIQINSKSSTPISVSIYNQIGQLVSNTFECQPVNGYINVQWDRTGMNYQRVRSGIYFVKIKQDENIMVKKIVLE